MTCSIAYGVIAGIGSYLVINGVPFILKVVSGGRIVPPTYGQAEPWVVPPGGIVPQWMQMIHRHVTGARGQGPEVQLETVDMRGRSETGSARGPDSASDYEGDKYMPHPAAYPVTTVPHPYNQSGYPGEK